MGQTDPQVLLCLIAVRILGPTALAKADAFKGLKKSLEQALTAGWLRNEEVDIETVTKTGKRTKKKGVALALTKDGEKVLLEPGRPEVAAAASAAFLDGLRRGFEQDRQALREQVLSVMAAKGKGKAGSSPGEQIAKLMTEVQKLSDKLQKLHGQLQMQGDQAVMNRIDEGFGVLQQKLERALATVPVKATGTTVIEPAPAESLQAILKKAYDKLCLYVEFEDGVVEIPRLYHEARRVQPQLSVEAFHRELQRLWDQRELELKILNEVRAAAEPDKAIRRGDNFYYFVYWRRP